MKRFGKQIAASLLSLVLMAGLIPAAGAVAASRMGDINGDGYVDAGDALLALRCAVDDYTLSAEQALVGDVTGDGSVNAGDAVLILRYDAGLVDSLGDVPENDTPVTPPDFEEEDPDYTLAYKKSMKSGEVYADLGAAVVHDYAWTAYINGLEQKEVVLPLKSNLSEWPYTGEGTLTEIYVDDEAQTVTVYEINYYLGRVRQVRTDTTGEYITVKELSEGSNLDVNTFYVEGYEENDYVVYTSTVNEDERNVIGKIYTPKTVTAEITAVNKDDDTGSGYVYGGNVKYVYAEDEGNQQDHMVYDLDAANEKAHPTLNKDYVLYLDPNGYVLAFERAEEEKSKYLYVKDSDEEMGEWVARVLLDDGTTQTIELNEGECEVEWLVAYDKVQKSNIDEKVFKYSVNDKGEYDLDAVVSECMTGDIKNGKAYISDGINKVIVDLDTVFVDDNSQTTYIGYDAVPNIDGAYIIYVEDNKVIECTFVLDGDIYDVESTYFMLSSTDRETVKYDSKLYWRYLDAYVDGENCVLTVAYNSIKSNDSYKDHLEVGTLYTARKSTDGIYITEVEVVEGDTAGAPNAVGNEAFWLTTEETKEVKFNTDENTTYVCVEYDENEDKWLISRGSLSTMKDPDVASVTVAEADGEYAELVYIFSYIAMDSENSPVPSEPDGEDAAYLYVKMSDESLGEWEAKVLLDDGSTLIVDLDEDAYDIYWADTSKDYSTIDKKVFKYTVNENGEYALEAVEFETLIGDIRNGKAYISDGTNKVIVDQDTVFVDNETGAVSVGYSAVPNMDNAKIIYVADQKIVQIAFVLDGEQYDTSDMYFMLSSTDRETIKYDGSYYWCYTDAYVDGEKCSLTVAYDSIKGNDTAQDDLSTATLYKVKKTVEETYITEVVVADIEEVGMPHAVGNGAFWLTTEETKEVKFTSDENTVFVYAEYNEDEDEWGIFQGTLSDMKCDDVFAVWVVESDAEYAELVYILASIGEMPSLGVPTR